MSCQSQNLPSTVADEDFFRGTLRVEACAPGIRREGGANLPIGITGLIGRGALTSDYFQLVAFDRDSHGMLDGFNGDHEVLFPALFQNSFQTIQAAASNPYLLSNLQESVEGTWDLLGEQLLQIVNLFGWNRSGDSPDVDQPDDSLGAQEFHLCSGG